MRKILKYIYNFVLGVLALLLIAVAATFLPVKGNYKLFTVQSGSMEPAVKLGSLIFVHSVPQYQVGDVITFKNGKNTVTHRVVEKKSDGGEVVYLTKGDANKEADPEEVASANVLGKTFFVLPYVGYPIAYARTKLGFILLVVIPAVIIVYEELWAIKEEILKKWSERKEKKKKTAILHQLSEDSYNSPNDVPETRMREIEERLAREAMMPERFERKARKKIV